MRPRRAIVLAGHAAIPLIGPQVDLLAQCGITQITVVAPGPHDGSESFGPHVRFVQNPFPRHTGGVFSLWLARGVLRLGALIVQAEAHIDRAALRLIVDAPVPDAVLVDRESGARRIDLAKVGPEGAQHLVRHVEALLAGGRSDASVSDAFRSLSTRWPLRPVTSVAESLTQLVAVGVA